MSASETVQSLAAVARAATERVAHSIAGESAPMSWAQAGAEIERALSTLERAGYRVTGDGTSRRMPLVR